MALLIISCMLMYPIFATVHTAIGDPKSFSMAPFETNLSSPTIANGEPTTALSKRMKNFLNFLDFRAKGRWVKHKASSSPEVIADLSEPLSLSEIPIETSDCTKELSGKRLVVNNSSIMDNIANQSNEPLKSALKHRTTAKNCMNRIFKSIIKPFKKHNLKSEVIRDTSKLEEGYNDILEPPSILERIDPAVEDSGESSLESWQDLPSNRQILTGSPLTRFRHLPRRFQASQWRYPPAYEFLINSGQSLSSPGMMKDPDLFSLVNKWSKSSVNNKNIGKPKSLKRVSKNQSSSTTTVSGAKSAGSTLSSAQRLHLAVILSKIMKKYDGTATTSNVLSQTVRNSKLKLDEKVKSQAEIANYFLPENSWMNVVGTTANYIQHDGTDSEYATTKFSTLHNEKKNQAISNILKEIMKHVSRALDVMTTSKEFIKYFNNGILSSTEHLIPEMSDEGTTTDSIDKPFRTTCISTLHTDIDDSPEHLNLETSAEGTTAVNIDKPFRTTCISKIYPDIDESPDSFPAITSLSTTNHGHTPSTGQEEHSMLITNHHHSPSPEQEDHSMLTTNHHHASTTEHEDHSMLTTNHLHSPSPEQEDHSMLTTNHHHAPSPEQEDHSMLTTNHHHAPSPEQEDHSSSFLPEENTYTKIHATTADKKSTISSTREDWVAKMEEIIRTLPEGETDAECSVAPCDFSKPTSISTEEDSQSTSSHGSNTTEGLKWEDLKKLYLKMKQSQLNEKVSHKTESGKTSTHLVKIKLTASTRSKPFKKVSTTRIESKSKRGMTRKWNISTTPIRTSTGSVVEYGDYEIYDVTSPGKLRDEPLDYIGEMEDNRFIEGTNGVIEPVTIKDDINKSINSKKKIKNKILIRFGDTNNPADKLKELNRYQIHLKKPCFFKSASKKPAFDTELLQYRLALTPYNNLNTRRTLKENEGNNILSWDSDENVRNQPFKQNDFGGVGAKNLKPVTSSVAKDKARGLSELAGVLVKILKDKEGVDKSQRSDYNSVLRPSDLRERMIPFPYQQLVPARIPFDTDNFIDMPSVQSADRLDNSEVDQLSRLNRKIKEGRLANAMIAYNPQSKTNENKGFEYLLSKPLILHDND